MAWSWWWALLQNFPSWLWIQQRVVGFVGFGFETYSAASWLIVPGMCKPIILLVYLWRYLWTHPLGRVVFWPGASLINRNLSMMSPTQIHNKQGASGDSKACAAAKFWNCRKTTTTKNIVCCNDAWLALASDWIYFHQQMKRNLLIILDHLLLYCKF